MELYNTKTRKKEEFKPLKQNEVKVYFCGPTVYNYAHIWNLRTYVFEDIVVKTLRFLGYNLNTVMNVTDIDDKTIKASVASGENLLDFTKKYTDIFLNDIKKIGISEADSVIPISDVIPEMARMIQTMLNRKNAYLADDWSIYFNVKTFKKYWKLANLDMSWMKESVRIDNDEYDKESAADFALWKAYKDEDGENYWEEEFEIDGKKVMLKWRPGWHIECSACNMKAFWAQIDIHMWWIDNLFPHHQNEVAQTESCTRKEFSKYWLHSGHLTVDGKKMSKSAWNFYTLEDLEEKYKDVDKDLLYRAVRLIFINWKYKDSIDFSFDKLDQAFNTIKKIDETLKKLDRESKKQDFKFEWVSKEFSTEMQIVISEYMAWLEDDFNMPEALAEFFEFTTFINSSIDKWELSLDEVSALFDMLKTFNQVLWIINFNILEEAEDIPDEIIKKLEMRNSAKSEKNFSVADDIRDELLENGYKIIDSRDGARLEKL